MLWPKEFLLATVMNIGMTTKYLYEGGSIRDEAGELRN